MVADEQRAEPAREFPPKVGSNTVQTSLCGTVPVVRDPMRVVNRNRLFFGVTAWSNFKARGVL